MIVLDPWTPTTPDPAAAARLEWAVGLALSVGWAWARAGEAGDLTLVVPGVPPVVASGRATIGFVRAAFAPLADLAGDARRARPSRPEPSGDRLAAPSA